MATNDPNKPDNVTYIDPGNKTPIEEKAAPEAGGKAAPPEMTAEEAAVLAGEGRRIHTCREGQNYQMLLPLYYNFNRIYIDEPLAYYVIRRNSHYHTERDPAQWLDRYRALLLMLEATLSNMGLTIHEINRCIKMSFFYNEERRYRGYAGD